MANPTIGVRAGLGRHATELRADQGRTIGIVCTLIGAAPGGGIGH